ncbi:MAG: DUF3881 family protein [Cellulosilyticaceae bacterium]
MESPLKSIGFSKLEDTYTLEDILSDVLEKPTFQKAMQLDDKHLLAEYIKQVAPNTYVMARVAVKKSKKNPKLDVYDCEPYVIADKDMKVIDVEIEGVDDTSAYYVICEEKETGMQLIFWLQNVVEYLEEKKQKKVCTHVNVAALASEGTIVLPIQKDEEEESFEKEEREKLRLMLQRMKEGDTEAKEILEKEEREMDNQLKERLKEEDFLSIMSGYFIPVTLEDATYAILGEIIRIQERCNEDTKEEMYVFTLSVNDMPLEIMIHKDTLVGMPSIGMRFMGTCWLQGKVIMA